MRASILTKIFLVLGLMAGAALMIAFHAVLGVDKVSRSVPMVEEAAEHARLAEQLDGLVNLNVMHSRLLYLADTPEKAKEASVRLAEALGAVRTMDLHWLDEVSQHAKIDPDTIRAALAAFVTARQHLVDLGAKGDFIGAKAAGDNEAARAPRLALSADIEKLKRAASIVQKNEGRAAQEMLLEVRATVSVIAISCVLLAFGLAVVLSVHLIGGPVRSLTAIMKRLAQGETDMVIPESSRTDEIGEMERALHVLRDTVKRNSDLVNELRSRDATEVLLRGQAAMGDRVMVFDQTLRSWIGRLAMLIGRLTEAAGTMTAASMRSREGTEAITVASRRAAADADNVAGSAELLSHAVEDIEQRIVDSAALVRQAVDRARATGDTVDELSSFSGRVGTIVQVIGEIAGQTNLLALNATIEAARAGEYGRGFAVVAQEVKTLASQTAKATAEITDQIAAIQRASHASAEALAAIQGKIAEVDRNSTAIALTADQQRSSTRHIASSIRATADHAKDMAQLAESLETASQEGATSAATFVAIVRDIDAEAVAMGREVERFFAGLKVA